MSTDDGGSCMGDIEFDAGSAEAMARVARSAADTLRGQAGSRRQAAEDALADFEGSYARRFRDAVVIEAEDRGRLTGVLDDLATDVDRAVAAAERERARRVAHDAWKAREAERRQTVGAIAGPFAGTATDLWDTFVDREPSSEALRPPIVDAEFRGRERAR